MSFLSSLGAKPGLLISSLEELNTSLEVFNTSNLKFHLFDREKPPFAREFGKLLLAAFFKVDARTCN